MEGQPGGGRAIASAGAAEATRREVDPSVAAISPSNRALRTLLDPEAVPVPPLDVRHGGRPSLVALPTALLRNLQRASGNASVQRLVSRLRPPVPVRGATQTVQRADVSVAGVSVSAKVSIPRTAGLTASAKPKNATGVTFSVEKGTVDPTGVTIGATTGSLTFAAGQQGGGINVKATSADGAWATAPLQIIEKPTAIASTTASGKAQYGGEFVHTFTAPSGKSSGLHGMNVNEKFASLKASPPWGGSFKLTANAARSHGWDLNGAGTMAGPDNVDIGAASVDIGPFVKSASNPSPKALPQGFSMKQSLHAKSFPGGRDATAFTSTAHKRTLVAGPKFVVEAGLGKITEDYVGPAAVTNAAVVPTTVMASPPKPKTGSWTQNKVQVTADVIPSTGTKTYSITGKKKLGCSVDANGQVSIGSTAGSITVRVSGSKKNYDEIKVVITPYIPPAAAPAPTAQPSRATPTAADADPEGVEGLG